MGPPGANFAPNHAPHVPIGAGNRPIMAIVCRMSGFVPNVTCGVDSPWPAPRFQPYPQSAKKSAANGPGCDRLASNGRVAPKTERFRTTRFEQRLRYRSLGWRTCVLLSAGVRWIEPASARHRSEPCSRSISAPEVRSRWLGRSDARGRSRAPGENLDEPVRVCPFVPAQRPDSRTRRRCPDHTRSLATAPGEQRAAYSTEPRTFRSSSEFDSSTGRVGVRV